MKSFGINNTLFICACILFLVILSYSFESFINSNATSMIQLTYDLPITKIEIALTDVSGIDISDTNIILSELKIIDENDMSVKYWESPNNVNIDNKSFEQNEIGNLYDENIESTLKSGINGKLSIVLTPPKKISSIQITNSKYGEKNIKEYELNLYNNDLLVGSKQLSLLGEPSKSVSYLITKPEKGPAGPMGPPGPAGKSLPLAMDSTISQWGPGWTTLTKVS